MVNLLSETNKALSNHNLTWNSVKFIKNEDGLIPVADFISMATNINYDDGYGCIHIDPTLKIVGGSWWLERFDYDGHEGWIFIKKPQRPTLMAVDVKLDNTRTLNNLDWEKRIEK